MAYLNRCDIRGGLTDSIHVLTAVLLAKPLYNHDIISIHFNHFYCTEFCVFPRMDLVIFTYIYLNVNEC